MQATRGSFLVLPAPPAVDEAPPPEGAGVAAERGDADELRDLAQGEPAELRQIRQQRPR